MRLRSVLGLVAAMMALGAGQALAADYPRDVHVLHRLHGPRAAIGDCVHTRVESIGPLPGLSTPAIRYRDGVLQDFDSGMLGQADTRPGDPIQLCLVSFTRNCGLVFADDRPGRTYATGNLRTGAAWTSPDIRSSCASR